MKHNHNYLTVEMLQTGDRIWRMATITSHSPIFVFRNGLEIGRMRQPQLSRIPSACLVRNPSAGRSMDDNNIFVPARTYPAPIGPDMKECATLYVADPTAIGLGEVYIRRYRGNQFAELCNWSLLAACRNPAVPFRFLYHWQGGPWRNESGTLAIFPDRLTPRYV